MPEIASRNLPPAIDLGSPLSKATLALTIIFMSIGLSALGLRIWARFLRKRQEGIEDILIYIATPVYIIHAILGILLVSYGGVGTRNDNLDQANINFSYKMFMATNITYGIVLTLSKCSILCLYLRVFAIARFRLIVRLALGLSIVWGILAILSEWITCVPLSYAWDRSEPGSCEHAMSMLLAVGILDVIGDLTIFILPIPVIKLVQVSKTEKSFLYGLFGIGAISIIASAVRVTTFTYSLAIWTQLEPALSIIVSCGMLLRPVLHKIFPRPASQSDSQGYKMAINTSSYKNIEAKNLPYSPLEWSCRNPST